jgi:hypothetical protein
MSLRRKPQYFFIHAPACDNNDAALIQTFPGNLISNENPASRGWKHSIESRIARTNLELRAPPASRQLFPPPAGAATG